MLIKGRMLLIFVGIALAVVAVALDKIGHSSWHTTMASWMMVNVDVFSQSQKLSYLEMFAAVAVVESAAASMICRAVSPHPMRQFFSRHHRFRRVRS